jgi:hypothetical protein
MFRVGTHLTSAAEVRMAEFLQHHFRTESAYEA